jgi:L-lactate dehydrogenase complex protein LldE
VKMPMISAAMGDVKAGNIEASGAEFVVSSDPSCLLHIDGILRRRKSDARAIYIASVLANIATETGKPSNFVSSSTAVANRGRATPNGERP